jgi:hypothetical protein
VKLLDEPVTPQKKVWPPRRAIVLGGILFSLFSSIGWVMLRRNWSEAPESDPGKHFLRTVLGVVWKRKTSVTQDRIADA